MKELALLISRGLGSLETCPEGLHYLESAFGGTDADTIALAMDNGDESVVDMFLFPPGNLDEPLEKLLLKRGPVSDQDELNELAREILDRTSTGTMVLPDGGELEFALAPGMVRSFLVRCRVSAQVPESVIRAARERFKDEAWAATLPVRRSRIDWHPRSEGFMTSAMEKLDRDDFPRIFPLALELASQMKSHEMALDFLHEKKRELTSHLKQDEHTRKQLSDSNFETMIQQGMRVPHLDREKTRNMIEAVDALGLALFGVRPSGSRAVEQDMGSVTDEDGIQRLMDMTAWQD